MRVLSNEVLLDAYKRAVELHLDEGFIRLLLKEIQLRKLKLQNTSFSA